MQIQLTQQKIIELLNYLNDRLATQEITGELYLVGGAVMCLVYSARNSTRDVDAYFQPSDAIRQAVAEIASTEEALEPDWLNDSVKGFLSPQGEYHPYLDLSHLKIYTAQPEYLLAMKCLSMRQGGEYQDEQDVQFLLDYLHIKDCDQALEIITRYYPLERFPQKTLYVLEGLLEKRAKNT